MTGLLLFSMPDRSFTQCPYNIDFEDGTFTGWTCWIGHVQYLNGLNKISLTAQPGPVPNRHEMMSAIPGNGLDPYGLFPMNCPNGSLHSIKLGNNSGGAEAEGVSYTFTIPPGQDQFSLIYHYAVVFQDPGHLPNQQPRMEIEIMNLTDNNLLGCSSFDFIASSALPGFFLSQNPGGTTPVWCKDWSANSINLDGNAGKTIRLFFKTADCTFSAHFGYAYLDVNSECSSSFVGATFCPDDSAINVTAPYGYESYTWYDSVFNQVLGTQQILHMSPPPPSGTSVKVVLTPYSGYGCVDTLTARLLDTLNIHANAGPDTIICKNTPVQLGTAPDPAMTYSWSPAAGLSDPNISNPIATVSVSTTYILTVKHNGGGCVTMDTVNINIVTYDSSMTVTGPIAQCASSGQMVILTVHTADSIQWYRNGIAIPGANQVQYTVTQSGDYSATLFSFVGCSFNTPVQHIDIFSSPIAGFSINNNTQCTAGNQFIFINTSVPRGGLIQYSWDLGDGSTFTSRDITHSYTQSGTYTVKMIITGPGGCSDSIAQNVTVYPSPTAKFSVNTANQCFSNNLFVYTDASTVSSGSLTYNWDLGDGTVLTTKNVSHHYILPGPYTVKLTITASGTSCTDTTSYNVLVYPGPAAGFSINQVNQCFPGHQFTFTNTSSILSGTMTYIWNLGDGTINNDTNVIHSYAKPGSYPVKLLVNSVGGCSDSTMFTVHVYPMPTADFTVQSVCTNLPVPLRNNTVNNTSSTVNYFWDFGNGQSMSGRTPVYRYPAPGNYTIKLSVSTAQCPLPLNTLKQDVMVDVPTPGINYPVKDAVFNFPEQLQARKIGNNVAWFPGISLDNRNSYSPVFKGLNPQFYTIELRTPDGCLTIDTQIVKTHKKIAIYVPTVFTPGGSTGLNDYLRPLLMGFDHVNYFKVYNRWGKLLYEMKSDRPGWDGKINSVLQEMQAVVWMIEAVDVDGITHHDQGTTILMH